MFKRLLLALVPGSVIAVPTIVTYVSDSYSNPFTVLTAAWVFCALFGGLVMAPFITSRAGFGQRTTVLMVIAPVFYYVVTFLVSLAEPLTNRWSSSELTIPIAIFTAVIVFNLLNALLLVIVAPLGANRMFWGFVGLAGAVTGVFCAVLFHYFFCLIWCDWTELLLGLPLFVWPLFFSASVHLWKKQQGENQPSDAGSRTGRLNAGIWPSNWS